MTAEIPNDTARINPFGETNDTIKQISVTSHKASATSKYSFFMFFHLVGSITIISN